MHQLSTKKTIFPESHLGCLDANAFIQLAILKKIIDKNNCLLYYQLLLPIYDLSELGIKNDPCMAYCSKVEEWSNMYVDQIGLRGLYRNYFYNLKSQEIVVKF